ncbi:unnamed protein product [Rhizophagus irregularis]|nr:unnamed protein product [Rhizophagus irregularis]CAB4444133.1 unnamed protein product [Rhizophagus irregularis]
MIFYIKRDSKTCLGNFPNEITIFSFTPNPLVWGQESTGRIAGKATIPIENGALYKITGFYEKKQPMEAKYNDHKSEW